VNPVPGLAKFNVGRHQKGNLRREGRGKNFIGLENPGSCGKTFPSFSFVKRVGNKNSSIFGWFRSSSNLVFTFSQFQDQSSCKWESVGYFKLAAFTPGYPFLGVPPVLGPGNDRALGVSRFLRLVARHRIRCRSGRRTPGPGVGPVAPAADCMSSRAVLTDGADLKPASAWPWAGRLGATAYEAACSSRPDRYTPD
jgi:hypothetical protein